MPATKSSVIPAAALALLIMPVCAFSQAYPTKPIRIISSSPAGNSGDVAMRMAIPAMSAALGQPILMENRTAAGGQVAAVAVKTSPPDGYNFMHMSTSMVATMFMVKDVQFDGRKDFAPVSMLISVPSLWAVSAALPANNINEFIDYAKRNPGKLAYGSTGIGTAFHLVSEAFSLDTGIKMLHVPYSAGGVAVPVTDLANDRIQLYLPSYTSLLPVLKTGNVKVLTIVDRKRLKVLPEVPHIFESIPNYTLLLPFFGVLAPAGTSRAITGRFQTEMRVALRVPDTVAKLEGLGSTPVGNTPEEFAEDMRLAIENTGKVVKALGIPPQ
ncbi:MAG: tripartite tricarboxylate transporter substrate binding protein [Betaproteobacteria bacterium]|nr:tripartite tricarboxylate transporter substrate binding protein [Betaproteobacteria bacterium]